ncbi:invasion associated locus B family protein [Albibacillus kandeliae]|uniref:invasion associated locus B family protein n=1 Tax=Albibacillus kandeliae TaxID=2174228 RepID=UPI000D694346|nr:invasion associated locus B family protein [Albibacillus kandeliae]
MFKNLPSLAALALIAFAAPAVAQETAAQTEDSNTSGEQLDLGTPVTDGPQLGQRYSKEKLGDWDLACIKTDGEQDPCSLLQVLHDDKNNPIAEFSLFRIDNGSQAVAGATVIVPLETLLPAQLTIAVDDNLGKRYNYTFCNQIGCVAQIGLTEADITSLKKGSSAKITIRPAPAPDQAINLTLSLKGFTAGYDIVDVVKK